MQYQNTLKSLVNNIRQLESQHRIAVAVHSAIALGQQPVFQVHIQADSPERVSIMAENADLETAIEKARRLWNDHNNSSGHPQKPRYEVFARFGNILLSLDPADVGAGCVLDSRVGSTSGKMVFAFDDRLPSCHYATKPTPERSELVSA